MPYDHLTVEPKWQARWRDTGLFRTRWQPGKPKFYALDMFPYPSGAGLHVGHCEGYTATDIIARWKRMQGFNVLHPMGWDAFGLPAENYAIKTGVHPRETTQKAIANFRRQIDATGFGYDWEREVNTTDPGYVRWTQWIFLKLFERGLAYEGVIPINWCPSCKTGLANEEVSQGRCERCGAQVERKDMRQWLLRITRYADRLLADLDQVDWPESTLAMQRNWIGRSEGADVGFRLRAPATGEIRVFTTRPDTLYGATYMVLAPEHALVDAITTPAQRAAVVAYQAAARHKSDLDRTDLSKEKTGVFTGAFADNPVNGKAIPVWIADYVLATYGTGAIMAVPGHDERDHEFARRFDLPIVEVVRPVDGAKPADLLPSRIVGQREDSASFRAASTGGLRPPERVGVRGGASGSEPPPCSREGQAFSDDGVAVNSGDLDGLPTAEAKKKIVAQLEARGIGRGTVSYRLRDWVFSRQRYWGEPIPIVHCAKDGVVAVPESDLPVRLPEVERYAPTGTGESPLAAIESWVATTCPTCGGPARRETNTMPNWAGSCWYYLRFLGAKNDKVAWSKEEEQNWMPVDLYVGGAEHAVLHLLYARFWHKVLFDLGLVSTTEPFKKLRHQGTVLAHTYEDEMGRYHDPVEVEFRGEDAFLKSSDDKVKVSVQKMAKSMLNGVNPDDVVREHGADVMRLYEMFMGEFELPKPWDTRAIEGMSRFLRRVWRLVEEFRPEAAPAGDPHLRLRHKTIRRVTEDMDRLKFNTAVSAMMEYTRDLGSAGATVEDLSVLLRLLSPFAPHLGDEAWEVLRPQLGAAATEFALLAPWPTWDQALTRDAVVTMGVQVNGKLRGSIDADRDAPEAVLREMALAIPNVQKHLEGKTIRKVVVVPGKIVNVVVG